MTSFYLIEAKSLGATNYKGSRIKLTYLHYPADNVTISFDYSFSNVKDQVAEFLKIAGVRVKGYGFDEKRGVYIFVVDNYERLRDMKNLLKGLSETPRGKDMRYYNAAQKHERAYLPKRKTVRTYTKKKTLAAGKKILSAAQLKDFKEWILDGNATEVEPGVWLEQTTQWRKKFNYEELQKFFKREYL
jgi:hypothetical protein